MGHDLDLIYDIQLAFLSCIDMVFWGIAYGWKVS
jgi:hypothetical protein